MRGHSGTGDSSRWQVLPWADRLYAGLGRLHYEWNRLDTAAKFIHQCIELCQQWEDLDLLARGYVMLARLELALSHPGQAEAAMHAAHQLVAEHTLSPGARSGAVRSGRSAPGARPPDQDLISFGKAPSLPMTPTHTSASLNTSLCCACFCRRRLWTRAGSVRALASAGAGCPWQRCIIEVFGPSSAGLSGQQGPRSRPWRSWIGLSLLPGLRATSACLWMKASRWCNC